MSAPTGGPSSAATAAPGTLLITGGAGFIGGAIREAAVAAGWRVRVLDSLRADVHGERNAVTAALSDTDTDTDTNFDTNTDFIEGDVRDADTVARALDGVDVVCHQAAKVGLGVDLSDSPDYVSSNGLGTAVLLAAMADAGVARLVLASSMVVYGEGAYRGPNGRESPPARRIDDLEAGIFDPRGADGGILTPEFVDESVPLDPRNVYAATKAAQEYLAASWARASQGRAIALRYHNVYGPLMPQNTPYAGVASLFRSALERGEAPRVFEDGGQRRDFVHVRDVAGANLAAINATADAAAGSFRAYNVGSGTVHTIGDLASSISRHSGGPEPIITGEFRLGDVRHITASSDRIRDELGWRAAIPFDDGMAEFATAPLRPAVTG